MARTYNTFGDFTIALARAYEGLNEVVYQSVNKHSAALAESIRNRVSSTGKDANDKFFSPYSTKYKGKRQKQGSGSLGKQTGYKGFYFQGTMWSNFRMTQISKTSGGVKATLGFVGSNAFLTNDELNVIHSKKEGVAIGMANEKEQDKFADMIADNIYEYLKRNLE